MTNRVGKAAARYTVQKLRGEDLRQIEHELYMYTHHVHVDVDVDDKVSRVGARTSESTKNLIVCYRRHTCVHKMME